MKKYCALLVVTGSLLAAVPAGADTPDPNAHNCAGSTSSELATQYGSGFGSAVSGAAEAQAVDNFGLANCGQPPRQNL